MIKDPSKEHIKISCHPHSVDAHDRAPLMAVWIVEVLTTAVRPTSKPASRLQLAYIVGDGILYVLVMKIDDSGCRNVIHPWGQKHN